MLIQAQHRDIWNAFYNSDSTLIGYRDIHHNIRISPKFTEFTTAVRFQNIIGVSERSGSLWISYYLNKKGHQFGADSLYITDNTPDCENEGYIRFRDRKTDKTGMFNRNGKIVIPAIYNELSKVRNGMIVGLTGAHKNYMHEDREKNGDNYYVWTGGKEVLIDTLNNVVIEEFSTNNSLNFYSLQRSSIPATETFRTNFKTKDGLYYSFIDFKQEFMFWLKKEVLFEMSEKKLEKLCSDSIIWESRNGETHTHKHRFIKKNYELLRKSLLDFNNPEVDHAVFINDLNPFIYKGPEFENYFNNCGEAKTWEYPVLSLIFTYTLANNELIQNHFDFLRTEKGYKLISVTIRTDLLAE